MNKQIFVFIIVALLFGCGDRDTGPKARPVNCDTLELNPWPC